MKLPLNSRILTVKGPSIYLGGEKAKCIESSKTYRFKPEEDRFYYLGQAKLVLKVGSQIRCYLDGSYFFGTVVELPDESAVIRVAIERQAVEGGSFGPCYVELKGDDLFYIEEMPASFKAISDRTAGENAEVGYFSADLATMRLLVWQKKRSRLSKGLPMPKLFVVSSSSFDYLDTLTHFLSALKDNLSAYKQGTRFQLVVGINMHWLAVDIEVREGSVRTFILDAARERKAATVREKLRAIFPDGQHFSFSRDTDDDGAFLPALQNSKAGCRVFAIEHAVKLSTIPGKALYKALESCVTQSGNEITIQGIKDNPEEAVVLMPLLTSLQSYTTIQGFPKRLKEAKVGKWHEEVDGSKWRESFEEYVDSRSGYEGVKWRVKVIEEKSQKKSKQLLKTCEEFEALPDTGMLALESGVFLVSHPDLLKAYEDNKEWSTWLRRVALKQKELAILGGEEEKVAMRELGHLYDDVKQSFDMMAMTRVLFELSRVESAHPGFKAKLIVEDLAIKVPVVYRGHFDTFDLTELVERFSALMEAMPRKANWGRSLFGVVSKHDKVHGEFQAFVEKFVGLDLGVSKRDTARGLLLDRFERYATYIMTHGDRSKEKLESLFETVIADRVDRSLTIGEG